ncbi:MAG: hypothetical protein GY765_39825 [bacterium]|nr:hypothetical protein [bacterium]
MKKVVFYLVLLVVFLGCLSSNIFADGQTDIPQFHALANSDSNYYVTNLYDETIHVEMIFYQKDGTMLFETGTEDNGFIRPDFDSVINYTEGTVGDTFTVSFDLASKSTARIIVGRGILNFGHGKIKWTHSNKELKGACLAHGYGIWYKDIGSGIWAIPINNGKRF